MLIKKRAYRLSITAITFFLGAAFQFLLAQWLPSQAIIPLTLILILISLVLILTISSDNLNALETVIDLASRSGIRVEYIEDDLSGRSYQRTGELVKKTRRHITIVSPWEPYSEYQPGIKSLADVKNARQEYYEILVKQIDLHKHHELFHRRIIQVPEELLRSQLTFKVDFTFYNYLRHAAEVQRQHPRSCRLRKAELLMNIHFTILDDQYVIMPIFTSIKRERLTRHGVFIFDDRQGDLIKALNEIYETLDAKSQPIESEQLIAPKDE